MRAFTQFNNELYRRQTHFAYKTIWERLHIDATLFTAVCILVSFGLIILYSAASQHVETLLKQCIRLFVAFTTLLIFAQIPPKRYRTWDPWLFALAAGLLVAVLIIGKIGKGAQRWLDLGLLRFQPSELMKLAMPMMLAWYFENKQLPPKLRHLCFAVCLLLIPTILTAKQPDLGTALVILTAGGCVILLAGLSWRWLAGLLAITLSSIPFLWHMLHNYQKQRLLTFFSPERDPLGHGYHIIQSKIAIGSGGLFGKGWLNGTQSRLHFLPEHATDFIFAVCGEEFGLIGCTALVTMYLVITLRILYIASQARSTFTRLLAGSLGLTFFVSAFVNIGMVTGLLPVVGLPLPLVSYGGTSMVTIMAGFGIIMSIHTHRRLSG